MKLETYYLTPHYRAKNPQKFDFMDILIYSAGLPSFVEFCKSAQIPVTVNNPVFGDKSSGLEIKCGKETSFVHTGEEFLELSRHMVGLLLNKSKNPSNHH